MKTTTGVIATKLALAVKETEVAEKRVSGRRFRLEGRWTPGDGRAKEVTSEGGRIKSGSAWERGIGHGDIVGVDSGQGDGLGTSHVG